MVDHRIRLTDEDLDIIVAALKARVAMARSSRRHSILRLIDRLSDVATGNPQWRLDPVTQAEWKSMAAGRAELVRDLEETIEGELQSAIEAYKE